MMKARDMKPLLKPCPFCGGQPKVTRRKTPMVDKTYSVACEHCGIDVYGRTDKEAIERWNVRPSVGISDCGLLPVRRYVDEYLLSCGHIAITTGSTYANQIFPNLPKYCPWCGKEVLHV